MAKKVVGYIKLQIPAGKANPSPPVGPALGQRGLNIMEFCKAFNAATQGMEPGLPTPVVITAYADKSFTFVMKTPPASILLKKAAGLQKGSSNPLTNKVGTVTRGCRSSYDCRFCTFYGLEYGRSGVMAKVSKRLKAIRATVEANKLYALDEAIALVKKAATAKFDESIDVSFNLGVDPRKSDQVIRGSVVLPKGTGKTTRVAVFTQGANADAAKAAGADIVGFEDLAEEIKKGNMDFDVVIASPDAMRIVGQLGTILGPRGLMPNPKVGTVTPNVAEAVKNAKAGQVQYRTDKAGIVHATIGRASFVEADLKENFDALLDALVKAKPAAAKGQYLKKIAVSSTMGLGVRVDTSSVNS